ncbi:hypothetical protein ACQPW3_06120 [Actinosynnema sp. CA-248983]
MDLSRRPFSGAIAVAVDVAAAPGRTARREPRPHRTSTPHLLEAEQLVGYLSLPTCPLTNNRYKTPTSPTS